MRADAPVRSLVLWLPDWPVTALIREEAPPDRVGADAARGGAREQHGGRLLGIRPCRGGAPRPAPP